MNHLRIENLITLWFLFFVFGYDEVKSTIASIAMDDNGYCGFSDVDEDLCSSFCYKSLKAPLSYIIELKEEIKAKAQERSERDNENRELRQRLLDLSDYKDHIKILNQQIEELRKTNDILRESAHRSKHIDDTDTDQDVNTKENDLNECMTDRDNFKREIELERQRRVEVEGNLKMEMEKLRKESDKDLKDCQEKEENFNNEINVLKSKVLSYEKKLEEFQKQLSSNKLLDQNNFEQLNKIGKNLVDSKDQPPIVGCKGLPSGIHTITIPNLDKFPALCNGDISDGGWIVIQKRFDGSEDFYRNWADYRKGFGNLDGEFFIGLDKLYRITNSSPYEMYIKMEYFNGKVEFARYDNFRILNEERNYELQSLGDFNGTTVDHLKWALGAEFSTFDHDNDHRDNLNWAEKYHSGWWYKYYFRSNLNGRYYDREVIETDSMHWMRNISLKSVELLIRQKLP